MGSKKQPKQQMPKWVLTAVSMSKEHPTTLECGHCVRLVADLTTIADRAQQDLAARERKFRSEHPSCADCTILMGPGHFEHVVMARCPACEDQRKAVKGRPQAEAV